MAFQLIKTKITVEGTNGDIIFSNLIINQYLADVNAFSFIWRQEKKDATLSNHISFYQKNLSKVVTINIHDNFIFKGIIYAINCNNQDSLGVSYEIIGKGLFIKLDEVPECYSFYKKSLTQIFNTVNNTQGTTLKLSPKNTKELFYTVQYNQTGFEFFKMMAARHGEWLYYNGSELILGNPASDTVSLKHEADVFDTNITAKVVKAPQKNAGFDQYKGEVINGQQNSTAKGGGLMAISVKAGENVFGSNQTITHVSNAVNKDVLKDISTLKHQAASASTVFVSARSYNSKLKLAGKIKMQDAKNNDAGEYIITEIHHTCITDTSYENQFTAVPAETEVPPYTNPQLYALCKPQPALVKYNEDKDGLDRIKVQFPWQQSQDTTPWISVLTPHAGKDKGIRFLPEIDEEVLIGFLDNNAERPFVMGAVHTDKNKSGNAHSKNNVKVIGTKTGRRLEIDDDAGFVKMVDNWTTKKPINVIQHQRKDSQIFLQLQSQKDEQNGSVIRLNNGDKIGVVLVNGGENVTEIVLEAQGKKIKITSKGTIDITADKDINIKADNINIKASQELNMEGQSKGVNIKGQKVKAEAQTTMDVKGTQTKVEGSAKLDLKGGAMASLNAGMVKIN